MKPSLLLLFLAVVLNLGLARGAFNFRDNYIFRASINAKLFKVGIQVDITGRNFVHEQLEKLYYLDENLLKIFLYPKDNPLLVKYFAVKLDDGVNVKAKEQKALDYAKYVLYPEDFFPFKGTGLDEPIPRFIQKSIFDLLSSEQILAVLNDDEDYKNSDGNFLTIISAANKLRNLVVTSYREQVLGILGQVPKLKNLSIRLSLCEFDDYINLYKVITRRLELEEVFKKSLEKHSFFKQGGRSLEILNSSSMYDKLKEIVVNGMEEQLSISYRYLLVALQSYLDLFLLDENCNSELAENSSTWKKALDQFIFWLINEGEWQLEDLLFEVFGFKADDFAYDRQELEPWEEIFDRYLENIRQQFSTFGSIETHQQLIMVKGLQELFEPSEERVQTICKIIGLIEKNEFEYRVHGRAKNLLIGMRKVMAGLIMKWPIIDPLLEMVFADLTSAIPFLELLSKNDWKFNDLAIMDQFVNYLKQKGELKAFIESLAHKMTPLMSISGEQIKQIDKISTAESLFTWISEIGAN